MLCGLTTRWRRASDLDATQAGSGVFDPVKRCRRATVACIIASLVWGWGAPSSSWSAEFELRRVDDGVDVYVDGQLMTRYLKKSGAKPILFPLIGPTGKEMTRGYPMRPVGPKEKKDHVHHRSLWFTHGDVNGISFWHENENHGTIEHRKFLEVHGGKTGKIVATNDWIAPDGKRVCQDRRTFVFHAEPKRRWFDVEIVVTASDGEVVFGDTKEGSFGVRVAGSMRAELPDGGTIINSRGVKNKEAWGKQAEWVDYYGPVQGETVGLAILNHPSSFRFPTYWHVRTYGLFAANPFGLHHFLRDPKADGSHRLKPGESFTLRYRVVLHVGDEKEGGIPEMYRAYAAGSGKP